MEKLVDVLSAMPDMLQALIDNIPSPVYYKDSRGVYIIYNTAFRDYFDLQEDRTILRDVFQLPIRNEEAQMHHSVDLELLAKPGVRTYEMKSVRPDGTIRHELIRKATLPGSSGTPGGIVGMIMDISQQKRMEDEIRKIHNLESLGTFAGGIAHDFNNLLMAIVGNLSLARMNTPGSARSVDYLNEAERIVFLGKSLTQQLLTFSRGGDLVRAIIDPGRLVRSVTDDLLPGSAVKCVFDIPDDVFPVEADEGQIRQVIENIVRNAMESMPAGGRISIGVRNIRISPQGSLPLLEEDFVRITIADEGVGIAAEDMSHVFDPYFTTKNMGASKGVGLGLAVSYGIVKNHNGSISVEPGRAGGSVFHVDLPAYRKPAVKDIVARDGRKGIHGGSILILDDEDLVLEIARELLEYLGYSVTVVRTGERAVSLYSQALELNQPFDAVILDLVVPGGMGGKEVLQELMRIDPNVKAIISSGYLTDPIVASFREYGFSEVLTKPYNTQELEEKLQRIKKN